MLLLPQSMKSQQKISSHVIEAGKQDINIVSDFVFPSRVLSSVSPSLTTHLIMYSGVTITDDILRASD